MTELQRMPFRSLVGVIVGILGVVVFTFFAATRLVQVDQNTDTILVNCKARNAQMVQINDRFNRLAAAFDLSIETRPTSLPPLDPEVIRLYEEFKVPIELTDCDKDGKVSGADVAKDF